VPEGLISIKNQKKKKKKREEGYRIIDYRESGIRVCSCTEKTSLKPLGFQAS
jgi:hypothetical protein